MKIGVRLVIGAMQINARKIKVDSSEHHGLGKLKLNNQAVEIVESIKCDLRWQNESEYAHRQNK